MIPSSRRDLRRTRGGQNGSDEGEAQTGAGALRGESARQAADAESARQAGSAEGDGAQALSHASLWRQVRKPPERAAFVRLESA